MKSISSLKALRSAIASVIPSFVNAASSRRKIGRRCISERLESRRYFDEVDMLDLASSTAPEFIFEGQNIEMSLHYINNWSNDTFGGFVDYGDGSSLEYHGGDVYEEMTIPVSHYYDDDGASLRVRVDTAISSSGWPFYSDRSWTVLNAQPFADLALSVDGTAGTYDLDLSNFTDPSSVDANAGFTYAFSGTYAGLDDPAIRTSTPSFTGNVEDEDGVYYARIYDKNNGYSDLSSDAFLPTINIPGALVSDKEITLNWLDIADGEQQWKIQRALEGGTFQTIATLPGQSGSGEPMSFTDTGLAANTRYIYRLRAEGNGADTAYAAKRYVRTSLPTPMEVEASNVASGGANTIEVKWSYPENLPVDSFWVRCILPNGTTGPSITVTNPAARSVVFGSSYGLAAASEYQFQVQAIAGPGADTSPLSLMVSNFDEPSSPWNSISGVNGGWQGDTAWYGESAINGKLTLTFTAPKRHTYLSGSYSFSMEEYAPNATFTASMGGQTLKVSKEAAPSGRPGPAGGNDLDGYYTFYFAKPGDDAIKSDKKAVTVTIEMHGLQERPQGDPFPESWHHIWDYDSDNATSYFPFVGIVPAGSFAEGSTNAKFVLTRFQVTNANSTVAESPLNVTLEDLGGTAAKGVDYNLNSQATIQGGAITADAVVTIINNNTPEWTKDFNTHGLGKNCKIYGGAYFEESITDDDLHIDPLPDLMEVGDIEPIHLDFPEHGPSGSWVILTIPSGMTIWDSESMSGNSYTGTVVWSNVGGGNVHDVYAQATSPSTNIDDKQIILNASDRNARPTSKPATTTQATTGPTTLYSIQIGGGSLTPQAKLVGEMINLSVTVLPPQLATNATYSWNVPGDVLADYVQEDGAGWTTPLTSNAGGVGTACQQIEFFWYSATTTGTARTVSVTVAGLLGIGNQTREARFSVFSPDVTCSPTGAGQTRLGPRVVGYWAALQGPNNEPGVAIPASVSVPPQFGAGEWTFLQKVIPSRTVVKLNGVQEAFGGNGRQDVLDDPFPWNIYQESVGQQDPQTIFSTGNSVHTMIDTPSVRFDPLKSFTIADRFETYVMFRPSSEDKWVPLRRVEWDWTVSGQLQADNVTWNATPSSNAQPSVIIGVQLAPPEWNVLRSSFGFE